MFDLRKPRKKNSPLLVILSLLGPAIVLATPANAVLIDDFEYVDSITNHGWTINGDPSAVSTSTEQVFAGNRSLAVDRRTSPFPHGVPTYDFGDQSLAPTTHISIQFYDDLCCGGGNLDNNISVFFDNGTKQARIRVYNNATQYRALVNGVHVSAGGTRSLGWHTFEWHIENGDVDLLVDGTLLANDVFQASTLDRIEIASGDGGLVLFADNLRLDLVPEPGTLALFGLGLAGLGLARRKRTA